MHNLRKTFFVITFILMLLILVSTLLQLNTGELSDVAEPTSQFIEKSEEPFAPTEQYPSVVEHPEAVYVPLFNSVNSAFYTGLAMGFLISMIIFIVLSMVRGRKKIVNADENEENEKWRDITRDQLLERYILLVKRYDETLEALSELRKQSDKLLLPRN